MKKLLTLLALVAAGCSGATAGHDAGKQTGDEKNAPATTATDAATADDQSAAVEQEATTLVSFSVPAMSCPDGCGPVVQSTLAGLEGVANCEVDFDTKTARCQVDPDKFDAEMAVAALIVAGFEGTELKK